MGHIKDIANQGNIQTFPSATFEIQGDVPASQCSEAQIHSKTGQTAGPPAENLYDYRKFVGYDLTHKVCTITQSPTGNTGNFLIHNNTFNIINLATDPGWSTQVHYYIHNGGELITTRNLKSFAQFIHEEGYAYTIKGRKLYTNMPSGLLQDACKILFDPIT